MFCTDTWVWTEPKGTQPLVVVMWTDLNAPYHFTPPILLRKHKGEWKVPPRAFIRIEGWTTFDHWYLPIGGFLADIKATLRAEIGFDVKTEGKRVLMTGRITPAVAKTPITVEIKDERGRPSYLYGVTDERGHFRFSKKSPGQLPSGAYQIQAFVTAGGEVAETSSQVRSVKV